MNPPVALTALADVDVERFFRGKVRNLRLLALSLAAALRYPARRVPPG